MSAMLEPQPHVVADAVLMNRMANRDATALVELERRHHASLYAQVYAILIDAVLAERVVRDAFTRLWFEAARYDSRRSPWTRLRDIARELTRAERASHDSNGHWR
jgi:DNA-directed RNA polymerase specialized sigma24 family protein